MSDGTREGWLDFVGHAREAFDFLTRLGFVEISSTDTKLEWQGAQTALAVFDDPHVPGEPHLLGVELRHLPTQGVLVSLADALRVINPDHLHLARYQTSDPALVRAGLDQLASVVRDDCEAMLAGDPQVWQRVEEMARRLHEAYNLEARFHVVRERANHAWQAKDYATALSLYREMKEALTQPEKRRVSYLARVLADPERVMRARRSPMLRELQSPDGRWSVLIEDDDRVAYAYLYDGERIVGDVWLYNVDAAPDDTDWKRQPFLPFLQPRAYCLEIPFARLREDSEVKAVWSDDTVVIEIDGIVWARLASGSKPGWSRLASRAGPLAHPLRGEE